MAYRRRTRNYRPKRRQFRKKRTYRRKRTYKRKSMNSNFMVRGKNIQSILVTSAGAPLVISPTINDFPEFNNLKNNFEGYRIKSIKVRVIPCQNVGQLFTSESSNGGTVDSNYGSQLQEYYSAPYHKPIAQSLITEANIQSIDKSRVHSGFQQSVRYFKPAALLDISYNNGGTAAATFSKLCWSPRIETADSNA
ncbi:capsid protein [robinz virus RP_1170]|uniref:Capsid protein n=1 Tax=robinz virus RP_1170 TaxID=2886406 RepID=A0A8K1UF03_9CIRC|nr:capsid protein [robinz virus RP_1170]UDN67425.1 capsid protein [robinz virus RP_1170]